MFRSSLTRQFHCTKTITKYIGGYLTCSVHRGREDPSLTPAHSTVNPCDWLRMVVPHISCELVSAGGMTRVTQVSELRLQLAGMKAIG